MDATLLALGGILLKAVPTFLLVILLNFYLKAVFFKPLEKVLRQRYEATEGARKLAAESMERAAARTAEYEAAMRAAARRGLPGAGADPPTDSRSGARPNWPRRGTAPTRPRGRPRRSSTPMWKTPSVRWPATRRRWSSQIADAILRGGPHEASRRADSAGRPGGLGAGGPGGCGAARPGRRTRQSSGEGKTGDLTGWKWANFVVLAGGLGYLIGKNAGRSSPRARGRFARTWWRPATSARKPTRGSPKWSAAWPAWNRRSPRLRAESRKKRKPRPAAWRDRPRLEIAKIQAQAEQEIASAAKAARTELKRYAAQLAVGLAERKIRGRMTPAAQDALVEGFVRDLDDPSAKVQTL